MIDVDDLFVLHRGNLRDVVALRGLSLQVGPGERVVVHGPSGSGKSTLVRVLSGDLDPSAGRARISGVDASERSSELVGIISQGSGRDLAPELTCLQNVALQAQLLGQDRCTANELALGALVRFGVGALANRRPMTLSNGEAQRVGIASALVCSPRVIIADEPTGELDRASADIVYQVLVQQTIDTGATLLLVTHDPAALGFADRSITIRDGRVSEEQIDGQEQLIVDPRGWVRLPAAARAASGIHDRAMVRIHIDAPLQLEGTETGIAEPLDPHHNSESLGVDGEPLITATNISYRMNDIDVLRAVSPTISTGLTVIAGPSGSGKTTLLGLLAGLGQPTTGSISHAPGLTTAFGTSLAGFADSLDVVDNINVFRAARRQSSHPDPTPVLKALGIEHLVGRPLGALSGGERQRAGIARALCSDANAVLLDEPTSQLDEASAERIATALAEFAGTRAVVCTSHDPALFARATQLIELQ